MDRNFKLSSYQEDILNFVKLNNFNLLVDAKAGSGKTSTLLLIADELIKANKHCLFLSFNKSIVEELQSQLPDLASNIKTVHSLGQSFIRSYLYKKHNTNYEIQVDSGKLRNLCKLYYEANFKDKMIALYRDSISEHELKTLHTDLISDFATICNFIRLYCVDYTNEEDVEKIMNKFCRHLGDFTEEALPNYQELVVAVLNKTTELFENPTEQTPDGKTLYVIDFTDMIYFPVYYNMSIPYSLRDSLDTIMVDECIPETHFIETEFGKMMFRELKRKVDSGKQVKVKTFNEQTEQFEYKPVINVVDKGIRPVYEITTTGLNKIQATDNHPFMTQNGWTQLKDLTIGEDYLYLDKPENQKTKYIPNDDQLQLILGSALGDGSLNKISNNKNEYRMKFVQGEKQKDYLKFKQDLLNCAIFNESSSGYNPHNIVYTTSSKVFLLPVETKLDIIKLLDIRGLAILYMDDGSKNSENDFYNVRISCNSFTEEETDALIDKLKEYDVECSNFPVHRNRKTYNEIHINTENAKKFFKLIAPYMHKDCFYKNPLSTGDYKWDNKWKSFGGNMIKSIKYVGEQKVLDMEVQDNHNFFVSKNNHKNGSSILVHNCQDLSMLQQMFIKKLYTGYNRFIFVGDKFQSIYGFNGADCYAINKIKTNYNPKELPLNICYRCPEKVVRLAQEIVPSIEWNKAREDKGILETTTYAKLKTTIKPNDVIVGRKNKDLLKIYRDFTLNDHREIKFRNKDMVRSIFKDILDSLKSYHTLYAKGRNIDRVVYEHMQDFSKETGIYETDSKLYKAELNEFVTEYAREHKDDVKSKDIMKTNQTIDYIKTCMREYYEDGAYKYVSDCNETEYYEIILDLFDEFNKTNKSKLLSTFLDYLEDFLNGSLNRKGVPVLGSIHSMKGGEADRIYLFDYPRFPYFWADMLPEDLQQEKNMQYVAITRAKKELYLVLLDLDKAKDEKQREKFIELNSNTESIVSEINKICQ